jgi:hypothetical protein
MIKEKFIFPFLFLFISFWVNAQLSGRVIHSETRQPVPFATIHFAQNKGMYTDEQGVFHLNDSYNQIIVSCVGFKTDTILVNSPHLEILLKPSVRELRPVVISDRRIKPMRLGAPEKRKGSFSGGGHPDSQFAIFIPTGYLTGDYVIQQVYYLVKPGISGKDEVKPKNSFFRLRIYANENGIPGKDLLNDNLIVYPELTRGWVAVDITSYSIPLPKNGIFVAMEYLPNTPKVEWTFTNSETGKKQSRINYGHSLVWHKTEVEEMKLFWKAGWGWRDHNLFRGPHQQDYYIPCIAIDVIEW